MSLRKLTVTFALFGFGIPIVVLLIDWMTKGWYPTWVAYIWPTWIMLYPYGGTYFSFEKLLYILVSAGLNALIYALIGYAIGRVVVAVKQT